MPVSIFILPLVSSLFHVGEEFFWPGGFTEWYRTFRPEIAASLTPRFLIAVNAVLFLGEGLLLIQPSVFFGLAVVSLLAANTVFHIRGTIITRSYSPGLVTGVLLYLPLCIGAYSYALSTQACSPVIALGAFVVGSSYQFWSRIMHKGRAAILS